MKPINCKKCGKEFERKFPPEKYCKECTIPKLKFQPVTKRCKGYPEGSCKEMITDHTKSHVQKYCLKCHKADKKARDRKWHEKKKWGRTCLETKN